MSDYFHTIFAGALFPVLHSVTEACLVFEMLVIFQASVLPRNFITGNNVPVLLKKWGHLRKKWGHCEENDGTVIWRSKMSFPSVYTITYNSDC